MSLGNLFLVLVVSGVCAGSTVDSHTVTPIQKVLELLTSMANKSEAAKHEEEKKFASFSQWCKDQAQSKTGEISAANERIEMLEADIQEAVSRIRGLNDRVHELDEDGSRWHSDQKSTAAVREKEAADFRATVQDYSETLDALDRAIEVLKNQNLDRSQADSALVQLTKLPIVPIATKKALSAFLQQAQREEPDAQLFIKAPEANAYEFQSGGIVDMLEKLKDDFATKKSALEEEELNAQHNFELIAQQLADNIENAEHEVSKKKVASSETAQRKAESEGNLAQVTSDRDEDQKYLNDMNALCKVKTDDYESRSKLRTEEIAAIRKAVEIISGQSVAGAGEQHLPALLQQKRRKSSLAQTFRRQPQTDELLQARIASFLSDRAKGINSKLLSLVSQRVASDPFNKVKKMIKDLIVKLMEETTAETEHKGWCDAELATNKQKRDSLTEDVNKMTAQVEELNSEITRLAQDIANLGAELGELAAQAAEAAKERADNKATNEKTIAEAKEAQAAVAQAIQVLKDYYAKSAEATSLIQQEPAAEEAVEESAATVPAGDAPETWAKPYKGLIPEGGSVVDILEVVLSDFARLEAETTTEEASEQAQYEKFMFETEKDKALKENEQGHKQNRKTDKESALHSTQEELGTTQEQLDAALGYYEKLKPSCVDSGVTYEERVRRRQEEIQSLQDALKILSGEDLA